MKGSDIVDLVIVKLEEKSAFLTNDGTAGPIMAGGDNIDELKPVYSYINAHIAEAADEILVSVPLNKLVPEDAKTKVAMSSTAETPVTWSLAANANTDGSGIIKLPLDFLRLYSLRMDEWDRPVHKSITKTDHLYTLQHNKFTKGTPQKPVVVFSGDRILLDSFVTSDGISAFDYCAYDVSSSFQAATAYNTYLKTIESNYTIGLAVLQSGECKIVKQNTSGSTDTPTLTDVSAIPYLEYYSCTGSSHTINELLYIPHYRETTDYNRQVAEVIALNCAKKVLEVYAQTDKAAAMVNEINTVMQNMQL